MLGRPATSACRNATTGRRRKMSSAEKGIRQHQGAPARVTANDVAREAGVSRTTVSFVLNDRPNHSIPEQTRARVLEAASSLGYIPSRAGQALRRGHSDAVLLLIPDGPPISVLAGEGIDLLTQQLRLHGLDVITRRTQQGQPLAALWQDLAPAAVVGWGLEEVELTRIRQAGIPTAALDARPFGEAAGELQVRYLAAAGHRHLAYVTSNDDRFEDYLTPRLDGARRACRELGLDLPYLITVDLDAAGGAEAISRCHEHQPRISGVCTYNDDYAFAVLAGLHALGLTAPADLAVIGVDDIPLASLAIPPLTTVNPNAHLLWHYLAETVVGIIAGRGPTPPAPGPEIVTVTSRESV